MSTDQQQLREEFWKNHISSWKKSSLDIQVYCREHGISPHTFYYWRKKLATCLSTVRKSQVATKVSPFVPVEVTAKAVDLSGRGLPEAKWLAEFAVQLIRGLQ